MICMIDTFLLHIDESESFSKKISLPFAVQKRVANHQVHQNSELFSESFSFEANFYNKKRDYLKPLETKIKEKKPLWIVFGDGEALEIVITSMELVKSFFDEYGSPLKITMKIEAEVYYG